MPEVSIVVVSRGPSLALARLLRSLRRAERIDQAELVLGLTAGCVEEGRRLVERLLPGIPAQVMADIRRPPAAARNSVLSAATAPVLVFLDDDVEVPAEFLAAALQVMRDESVAAAGGPNLTAPAGSTLEQIAGRVLASAVGTGPVRDRYRTAAPARGTGQNLMLCNLVIRRSAVADPIFDGRLASAEENELLARLNRGHARIEYRPELAVVHHRRPTQSSHLRQMAKYGYGRGQMLIHAFSRSQLAYAIPSLLLAALPAAALFEPMVPLAVAVAWLGLIMIAAVRVGGLRHAHQAFGLFAATHLGYAVALVAGVFSGVWRVLLHRGSEGRRSPTARDAAGTLAALTLAAASASAAGILIARLLGPDGRGHFELARATALTLSLLAGLAISRAAIFLYGRGALTRQGLFGAVATVLATGSLAGALLAGGLLAHDWHGLSATDVALACLSVPLIAFYSQGHYALRGIGFEAWYRRVLAVRDFLFLILLLPAFALSASLTVALLVWCAHWLLGAAAVGWLLVRACGAPVRPVGATGRLVTFGAAQTLVGVLAFLHLRIDLLLIGAFRDAAEVGYYAVAFGVVEPLSLCAVAIGLVLFPRTVTSSASDPAGGRTRTVQAMRAAFVFALAGATFLALLGPGLVEFVFGSEFAPAGNPLRALLPGAVALSILIVAQSDLAGRGRIWSVAVITASAVGTNTLLAVLLVPSFGATGAAAASSLTYVLATAWFLLAFRGATMRAGSDHPRGEVLDELSGVGIS